MLNARALTIGMAIALAVVIVVSIRTPSRARASAQALHINVEASKRVGPLIDERGLLMDELAWRRSDETIRELQQIDAVIRQQSSSAPPFTIRRGSGHFLHLFGPDARRDFDQLEPLRRDVEERSSR